MPYVSGQQILFRRQTNKMLPPCANKGRKTLLFTQGGSILWKERVGDPLQGRAEGAPPARRQVVYAAAPAGAVDESSSVHACLGMGRNSWNRMAAAITTARIVNTLNSPFASR